MDTNRIPTIETARLRLRPFTGHDVRPLYQLMNGKDVMQYFPNPSPPTLDRVEKMLLAQKIHWEEHGYGWWAVESKETGVLLGWCGLQYLPKTAETEVGYLLGRDYWGQGLATEAARKSVLWGFHTLELVTIIAITHKKNKGSQRVAQKIGLSFVREDHYFGMACFVYALTRQELVGQVSN